MKFLSLHQRATSLSSLLNLHILAPKLNKSKLKPTVTLTELNLNQKQNNQNLTHVE